MSVSSLEVRETAEAFMKTYGGQAAYFASIQADRMLERGSLEGSKIWHRVEKAIRRLQRGQPLGPVN